MEKLKFNYELIYDYFERYTDKNDASHNKHEENQKILGFLNCDLKLAQLIENDFNDTYKSKKEKDNEEFYSLKRSQYYTKQYVKPLFKHQEFVYPETYTLMIGQQKFKINTSSNVLSDLLIALEAHDHKAILITKQKETLS